MGRKSKAVAAAELLYRERANGAIPTPVEKIARDLGIVLTYEAFEDGGISGALYQFEGDHAVIGVNSTHPNSRQRFTVAHELGHYMLHREERDYFVDHMPRIRHRDDRSSLAIDPHEIEANQFAAELLMPSDAVRAELTRLLNRSRSFGDEEIISQLASKFEVSSKAMDYRLRNLNILEPAI